MNEIELAITFYFVCANSLINLGSSVEGRWGTLNAQGFPIQSIQFS